MDIDISYINSLNVCVCVGRYIIFVRSISGVLILQYLAKKRKSKTKVDLQSPNKIQQPTIPPVLYICFVALNILFAPQACKNTVFLLDIETNQNSNKKDATSDLDKPPWMLLQPIEHAIIVTLILSACSQINKTTFFFLAGLLVKVFKIASLSGSLAIRNQCLIVESALHSTVICIPQVCYIRSKLFFYCYNAVEISHTYWELIILVVILKREFYVIDILIGRQKFRHDAKNKKDVRVIKLSCYHFINHVALIKTQIGSII
ncbi:hypothetical protein PHYBLDRAFT_173724 [Phycomyces blakesleeanus NRRL 1555(-)]|uniref:Uncharacterized protein n=1 Tax=Phycomyces blakesleeanus (strain ATCC 8743b / DSM 1359 / FGSC 10004 / NBRC 33097 / NRRL 1555) TaxID=763407 RepID=A0A167KD57_PHYB8|nr:hypothetical protein PHYBLDRAFT_173724 [Phycomyces blakesleeanus NRRL 1555(-)]OAD67806.1 hypothetical protein PHYBLDRAFT_173724 [Phycomyces blakesleeanus NRRL 1555(-)]|eukprot:XP_018285846.1 hypothetical protein PHYBLDRAFT_173724 [Phycomyces blakesleeanus NRRL 1555(-)]